MSLRYLFIDMNSYFASVEQQYVPALRGRPIAVAPVNAETTCCIAASYEAKRFGVKTGTPIHLARRLCPGIEVVLGRPELYIRVHHHIVAAVESCLPVARVMSIDEMVCRLAPREREEMAAVELAQRVKATLDRQVGSYLKCSIGIAPNRLLAKVAADMRKPDGLTVIQAADLPDQLLSLKLTDLPGVGPRMEKRLLRAGITTMTQLCDLDEAGLERIWGSKVWAGYWWHTLRGADLPEMPTHRRQVGHSHVLPPHWRNDRAARGVMMRMIHKAAARLRHLGYWAGSVGLEVRYLDRTKYSVHRRITPSDDTLTFIRALRSMWDRQPVNTPLKVGVVLNELSGGQNVTPSLFEPDRQLSALGRAMDELNRKFGRHAVYFGGMFDLRQHGSPRIAFNHIPDLDLADA